MRALTLWQPWASLIMIGAKPIEFRSWPVRTLVGHRIAIHAGKRADRLDEISELIYRIREEQRMRAAGVPCDDPTGLDPVRALAMLRKVFTGELDLPRSAVLGTALIGTPVLATDLGCPADSDRLDHQRWGWPLTAIEPFAEPIPMRGGRGFWHWPDAAEMAAA